MEEKSNQYALAALKDKRATLAGEIVDLKKQLAWRVSQLDHVDACLTIFEPGFDIKAVGIKRPRKRVKLFRQGELGRLIIDALRRAGKPLGTHEITSALLRRQRVRRVCTGRARAKGAGKSGLSGAAGDRRQYRGRKGHSLDSGIHFLTMLAYE
jgi:hypothetical protein